MFTGNDDDELINVAIPDDNRIENKGLEKITQYQDLKMEVERDCSTN